MKTLLTFIIVFVASQAMSQNVIINEPSGKVAIGIAVPDSKLHVKSSINEDPFKIQVGNSTKVKVHKNGGTSLGLNLGTGIPDGLYVHGNTEMNGSLRIGTYTLPILDGSDGQVLQTNGAGDVSWRELAPPAATYSVGDYAQGGVVIWVTPDGEHGKVVSIYDIHGTPWSNVTTAGNGFLSRSTTNGAGNTVVIIQQLNHERSAASICADYAFGGYDDWYLPSWVELQLYYDNRDLINATSLNFGGEEFHTTNNYWTSTEFPNTQAYYRNLFTGVSSTASKSTLNSIRPIRTF